MSFFSFLKREIRAVDLPGTGYQPLPRKDKQVKPPPKNPNSSSTTTERTLIMSDEIKTAVKEITKEHKNRIRTMHDNILSDLNHIESNIDRRTAIQTSSVQEILRIVHAYLKTYKKHTFYELNKLAETFLQEDPGTEITAGAYDQIKDLITSNNSTDLPDDITRYICDKLISCGYKKINNIKSTINSVVRDRLAANLIVLFEEMDENTVTVETVNIEELKKENASLKAKLAAIEALTK